MSDLPLEEVERTVGSKYSAVVAVAKRALEASRRFLTLRASRRNPIAWAMNEIIEGRVQVEVPTVEEAAQMAPRPTAAERLRVGFIHEDDLEMEAQEEIGEEELEEEEEEEELKEAAEPEEDAEVEEEVLEEELIEEEPLEELLDEPAEEEEEEEDEE